MGAPWAALGSSWASLGCLLEPLGAPLGPRGALLGALGAVLGPSWGCLRRLKTQIGEISKTVKNLRKIYVFGGSGSPRCGQVGPSSAQDGPKLGLSWHLEAILVPRWPKMAKMTFRMRLQIAKMRFWRHLGGLWGGPGAVLERLGAVNPYVSGFGLALGVRPCGLRGVCLRFRLEEVCRICMVL